MKYEVIQDSVVLLYLYAALLENTEFIPQKICIPL